MLKFLVFLFSVAFIFIFALPVWAGESEEIEATVTPYLVSLTLSESSLAYGVVPLNTQNRPPVNDPAITATNNGTVTERFYIKGANATNAGGDTWTLGTEADLETIDYYVHEFGMGSSPSDSDLIALTTGNSYMPDTADTAIGGEHQFKIRISTPKTISGAYTEYSTAVTVTATQD